ncbi:hypothetical protein [Bradyrhizobium sp. ARR65]|uniref:hypothetical protein n=1 Tax=Bradyrhizobium sp. ARR65 TaxID=1040989 RepID=UPI000464E71A|nr:hypothetical protein [Bradyrhizobium sp. ARR65]
MGKLRYISKMHARIGYILFGALVTITGTPGEAAARHFKHVADHRAWSRQARAAQASLAGTPHLGAIRYYGGPKAPMWRAPVEE